jgi:hypothetical protein
MRRINCTLTDAQWEHLSHCVAFTAVYLDDEIADGEASQSARGVHDRMWDKIVGIK